MLSVDLLKKPSINQSKGRAAQGSWPWAGVCASQGRCPLGLQSLRYGFKKLAIAGQGATFLDENIFINKVFVFKKCISNS